MTMSDTLSPPSDSFEEDFGAEAGANAFLKHAGITPEIDNEPAKKKPEEDTAEESTEAEPEEDAAEEEEGASDEEATEEPKTKKVTLEADADAWVKIGDSEVSLKDLVKARDLEASMELKAAEVEEARKATVEKAQRYATGLEGMLERAMKRAEPYTKLNFLVLAKDPSVTPEELTALSNEAQRAYDDVNYLKLSLDTVMQEAQTARHAELVKAGADAWKVLSNPDTGIKGWGQDMYKEVSTFAIKSGIPKAVVDELVDASAIKILHKAMLYDKGQSAVTTKVTKTPKKIIKGGVEPSVGKGKPLDKKSAIDNLRKLGNEEAGVNAFLSMMGPIDD